MGPRRERVVKTNPLSVRVAAGMPCSAQARVKVSSTIGVVTTVWAVAEIRKRDWSSSQSRMLVSLPWSSPQWVQLAAGDLPEAASRIVGHVAPELAGDQELVDAVVAAAEQLEQLAS